MYLASKSACICTCTCTCTCRLSHAVIPFLLLSSSVHDPAAAVHPEWSAGGTAAERDTEGGEAKTKERYPAAAVYTRLCYAFVLYDSFYCAGVHLGKSPRWGKSMSEDILGAHVYSDQYSICKD